MERRLEVQLPVERQHGRDVLRADPVADELLKLLPDLVVLDVRLPGMGGLETFKALPDNARRYLARIEELSGLPIDIVSTGPDRSETIVLRHPFD